MDKSEDSNSYVKEAKKTESKIIGIIDIGANFVKAHIAQKKNDRIFETIEDIKKPLSIGKDTFSIGRISNTILLQLTKILKELKDLFKAYEVEETLVFASTAIREAKNCDFIIERIKIATGIDIKLIETIEESFYKYQYMKRHDCYLRLFGNKSVLIFDIGSGGLSLMIVERDKLKYASNLEIGSLKLRALLSSLERETLDFAEILDEFIESKMHTISQEIKNYKIDFAIGLGGESKVIYNLIFEEEPPRDISNISKEKLLKFYNEIKDKTTINLVEDYYLMPPVANVLLPSTIIFKKILDICEINEVGIMGFSFRSAVANSILMDEGALYEDDILSVSESIAKKYLRNINMSHNILRFAVSIFDYTKNYHAMGDKERLLLKMACILHDVGKFVDVNDPGEHSYNIISSAKIPGLSSEERDIIANSVKIYQERDPDEKDCSFSCKTIKDRLTITKIAAILKLSNALDSSQKGKIQDIKLEIEEHYLIFKTLTHDDILLEKWHFDNESIFFRRIFGLIPVLKVIPQ
ncbi:hypothetical protein V4762_09420 [Thermodesulfobium sp. 4217-1]|uniref:Ppx/GppA phosphatase family protein n=1 Tax=Thermodesulfobium sp. 4217-1 TaxID=3120013 RepID=UPI003221E97C